MILELFFKLNFFINYVIDFYFIRKYDFEKSFKYVFVKKLNKVVIF